MSLVARLRPLSAALALCLAFGGALPLHAEDTARIEPLYQAIGLPALLEIMREEGIAYGTELEADLFPGKGRAAWAAALERIYGLDRMQAAIREGLAGELDDAEIDGIVAFFEAEAGARIVALEVAARRAMLDEAVEEAAREAWAMIEAEGGRRWELLIEFAEVNDLVESNVAGAMTSNYAFYMGLNDGRAFGGELPESQVIADVWAQEPAIREETVDWVYSYIALAYQPLSDAEFRDYIAYAATPEGQALNNAIFVAFNAMFAEISRQMGRGAARFMVGQDL